MYRRTLLNTAIAGAVGIAAAPQRSLLTATPVVFFAAHPDDVQSA